MYSFIIGIDVSKGVLDISYFFQGVTKYHKQIENSVDAIIEMIKEGYKITGKRSTKSWLICFENTGVYSKLLRSTLLSRKIDCVEEDPKQINIFRALSKGKRDDWDSLDICTYAVERQSKLTLTKAPEASILKLQQIFNYRSTLVAKKCSIENMIDEKAKVLDDYTIDHLKEINDEIIQVIKSKIKEVEKLMLDIIVSAEKLRVNFDLVKSVVGIGTIIGIGIIVKTENFTKFKDAKKFASQIGIAPFPHQSGKSKKTPRVSKRADISMKALVSNGVQAAIRYDPQITAYYVRLSEDNKPAGIIFNNIKNKLIHRAFAVVKRGTPYAKLAF